MTSADMKDSVLQRADRRLEALVAPQARVIALGSAVLTASSLLWAAQALAIASGLGGLWSAWTAAGVFLAVALLRIGIEFWAQARLGAAADRVTQKARSEIASQAARWSPADRNRPDPGRIAGLAADSSAALGVFVSRFAPAKRKLMVAPLFFLVLALAFSWTAALALLAFGAAAPILMAYIGKATQAASDRQIDEVGSMNGLLLDHLRVLPDLRYLGAAGRSLELFTASADAVRIRTMTVLRLAFLNSAALEICAALGVAATAAACGVGLAYGFGFWFGAPDLTVALFVLLLAPEFFQAFREFSAAFHDRAGARSFARALVEHVDDASDVGLLGRGGASPALADSVDAASPTISVRKARFRYPGRDNDAVAPISFDVMDGDSVALLGPSGSGKSTLLALLAGLARPSGGRIFVRGGPLTDERADAWRADIAWIGQKPHAISGSLAANIAFYEPVAIGEAQRISDAVKIAALESVVAAHPAGLRARLGETGLGLSGGELRRLGVARLAFAARPVVFADEPTAALDHETARQVADGLLALAQNATLIVATHDEALASRLSKRIRLDGSADKRVLEAAE